MSSVHLVLFSHLQKLGLMPIGASNGHTLILLLSPSQPTTHSGANDLARDSNIDVHQEHSCGDILIASLSPYPQFELPPSQLCDAGALRGPLSFECTRIPSR